MLWWKNPGGFPTSQMNPRKELFSAEDQTILRHLILIPMPPTWRRRKRGRKNRQWAGLRQGWVGCVALQAEPLPTTVPSPMAALLQSPGFAALISCYILRQWACMPCIYHCTIFSPPHHFPHSTTLFDPGFCSWCIPGECLPFASLLFQTCATPLLLTSFYYLLTVIDITYSCYADCGIVGRLPTERLC